MSEDLARTVFDLADEREELRKRIRHLEAENEALRSRIQNARIECFQERINADYQHAHALGRFARRVVQALDGDA